ncbi:hypothetical protein NCTGTJJY_CDS0043 [Serratia phage 92A1]|nr:hypothetical protein NCTGTJJY_CDS0043 [Serratia phage 92A1]
MKHLKAFGKYVKNFITQIVIGLVFLLLASVGYAVAVLIITWGAISSAITGVDSKITAKALNDVTKTVSDIAKM